MSINTPLLKLCLAENPSSSSETNIFGGRRDREDILAIFRQVVLDACASCKAALIIQLNKSFQQRAPQLHSLLPPNQIGCFT